MSNTIRAFFLSLTIVAIMLFSTFGATTVYADDETPTPTPEAGTTPETNPTGGTDPVTPTATGTGEVVPVSVEVTPPVDEVVPAEVAPSVDPVVTEVVTEVPAEPILEQVPENITVTVLNAEGEAQPLASQASADAIATTTDPIWCPATQTTPTPGLNGCTTSFTSFNDLLSFIVLHEVDPAFSFQQAGTIYIEQGAYGGTESSIDFNNYAFTQFNTQDLTLQGGWDPADNSVDSTSQFTAPIIIGSSLNPWVGSLTLNDISISDVTGEAGLTLFTQGDLSLSNVEVINSQAGAELTAAGNVTVADSNFSDNENAGANIQTTGAVQVTDSSFNRNKGYGVQIATSSEVSLVNVTAENNSLFGARIEAGDAAIDIAFFSSNGSSGLDVTSLNDVALFDVTANNNQLFGANIFAGNLVAIAQSNFNDGSGYGLSVVATSLIDLDGVNANNNDLYGAYLEGANTVVSNSFFTANGSLGVVSEPIGYGLKIVSTGTVNLTNINAADSEANQLFGADITAAKNVNISRAFFSGQQSEIFIPSDKTTNYYGYGLNVVTPDDIFLNYVVGNYNNLWGASLTGNDVTVYNSQFNNNVTDSVLFIDDTGLLVNASGYVDIYRTEAKENRLIGATITAVEDVYIVESNFSDNRGVLCYDVNCKNFNWYGYGLNVFTSANIYVNGTTANNNHIFGATLSGANVEVTNSTFNFNGSCIVRAGVQGMNCINRDPIGRGLVVNSSGNTSLINVTASNNERFGANVQAVGDVTITASIFSGNKTYTYYDNGTFDVQGYGLQVTANGDILLNADANGIGNTASDNGENGASLIGQSTITVSDSTFNNNGNHGGNYGLFITVTPTAGNIILNNVTATNNRLQDGVRVAGFCGNTVFVNGGTFTNNHSYGLKVKLSTLVLDGTQTFANNPYGNVFTNSDTCPPVAVPPVVVLQVVIPQVVIPQVVVPQVVVPPVDNNTTNNSNSSTTTVSTNTNSNTTTLNKGNNSENNKGRKGDKTFKLRKYGVDKIKMRGNHHFKRPCVLKVIPI
jgi:Right handed beta helix region